MANSKSNEFQYSNDSGQSGGIEFESLKRQVLVLTKNLRAETDKRQELQTKLAEANATTTRYKDEINDLKQKLQDSDLAKKAIKADLRDIASQRDKLLQQISEANKQSSKGSTADSEQILAEKEKLAKTCATMLTVMQQEKKESEHKIQILEKTVTDTKAELQKFRGFYAELKETMQYTKADLVDATSKLRSTETGIKDAIKYLGDLEASIPEHSIRLSYLGSKLDNVLSGDVDVADEADEVKAGGNGSGSTPTSPSGHGPQRVPLKETKESLHRIPIKKSL